MNKQFFNSIRYQLQTPAVLVLITQRAFDSHTGVKVYSLLWYF